MASSHKTTNILDPDFEELCNKWYNETNSDISDSEDEQDTWIASDHETASEQEIDSSEDVSDVEDMESDGSLDQANNERRYFYGKNRFKWSKIEPARNVRTPQHNIIRIPIARVQIDDIQNPLCFFNKLFSQDMYDLVITWTNNKLANMREKYKRRDKPELADIDEVELRAFLGLLLYTSIFKSNDEDLRSLFSTNGKGRDVFRAVMSLKRFLSILASLRFDNPQDRNERKAIHPGAAINEFFEIFIRNARNSYSVGVSTCVDEMLVGFRGRCGFKMYIPNKPCKYGLKILCLTDARTSYLYNAYMYVGRNSDGFGLNDDEKKLSKPSQAVIRLVKPLYVSNRNVTGDNWFSSIELVEHLLKNELTYVGTLRKNKREIPSEFLPRRQRPVNEALYGFTKNLTLVSHVPKKGKAVVLVSSMHHCTDKDINTEKPEIISWYNLTKGGVDSLDEKCAKYSCSRRTRRWPLAIFFKLVDICSVNAFIIYTSYPQNANDSRFSFIEKLADLLVKDHMIRRLNVGNLSREVKNIIHRIQGISEVEMVEERLETRKYCYNCPAKIKRKTAFLCFRCKKPICMQCSKKCCLSCCNSD